VFWNGKPPGIGMGGGGGIAAKLPMENSLTFNPEINFFRRNVYNHKLSGPMKIEIPAGPTMREIEVDGTIEESMSEFVIGIPLLLQFTPISNFYVLGGVLISIPFSSELTCNISLANPDPQRPMPEFETGTSDFESRSRVDIGAMLGAGYNITKNLAVDFRGAVDFTNISAKNNDRNTPFNPFRRDKTWLIQYGLGISYFI
jgi:opacity protein-like surface antigen